MIVKITNENAYLYNDLFNKITLSSNLNIQSLEDYYEHIVDISSIDNGKFLRMPLWDSVSQTGEPFFEINANTRQISVPANFKDNGIGVENDNLAEIVYFIVDRYYDNADLFEKNIKILWSLKNSSGEEQASGAHSGIFVDKDSYFNEKKIIFGWPIVSELVQTPGILTFSVCFYEEKNDEVVYSLNTLTTDVKIKAGFKIDNPEVVNFAENVTSNLENSAQNAILIYAKPLKAGSISIDENQLVEETLNNYYVNEETDIHYIMKPLTLDGVAISNSNIGDIAFLFSKTNETKYNAIIAAFNGKRVMTSTSGDALNIALNGIPFNSYQAGAILSFDIEAPCDEQEGIIIHKLNNTYAISEKFKVKGLIIE